MTYMVSQRKEFARLAIGAGGLLLGLLWLWSWQHGLPKLPSPVVEHPLAVTLWVASLLAAGWFVLRYRGTAEGSPSSSDTPALATVPGSDRPSARGKNTANRTADADQSLGLLVRVGFVAATGLLVGLVIGDLAAVAYAFAATGVAVAFLLIVTLVPRGL